MKIVAANTSPIFGLGEDDCVEDDRARAGELPVESM
jgi:hypothetical protein